MSVVLSVAFFVVLLFVIKKITTRRKLYPPGPKPLPLIGNVLDLPAVDGALEYVKWEKRYHSKILHASAFGTHIIVLNSVEDADALFERRATKYSNRPNIPIANLIGFEYNLGFIDYGDDWRRQRRICQQNLRSDAVKDLRPIITKKVHKALEGLLNDPTAFTRHNRMLSISIPMSLMYGYDVQSVDDPWIATAEVSISGTGQLLAPGGSMINVIPILRFVPPWFPGASSRKAAEEVRKATEEMLNVPMNFVKEQMLKGTAASSFVSRFLEKKITFGALQQEERDVAHIASTVYGGGSDTSAAVTSSFLHFMASYPNVQKKAQTEIDIIIGSKRLPDYNDRHLLPYIEAIYREVLRSMPPARLGVPHCLNEDDVYKGYFFPKGTMVIGNIWAMTHDEGVYPDPFTFKPERFLDANGALNDDNRILAYGFGRRICVGKHVASATLWMTFVSILATFNVGKAKDDLGNDIEINDEYEDFGFLHHKKPFKCSIHPRSSTARQLIEAAVTV